HFDVTYMPKFNKVGSYLYVAIDRATRTMYYKVYINNLVKLDTDVFCLHLSYSEKACPECFRGERSEPH
ncbi:MAG: hypothetical protein QM530_07460, partial [Phycisphaerales bacterium]|nr:hypothetical protein [Phycisphaerales bacterium]